MQAKNKYKHYLSFGFNCELAFALEKSNIFEATLFSWADVRGTDALISGILHSDSLLRDEVSSYSVNMFFCNKNRIGFHGKKKFSDMTLENGTIDPKQYDSSLTETRERLAHFEFA